MPLKAGKQRTGVPSIVIAKALTQQENTMSSQLEQELDLLAQEVEQAGDIGLDVDFAAQFAEAEAELGALEAELGEAAEVAPEQEETVKDVQHEEEPSPAVKKPAFNKLKGFAKPSFVPKPKPAQDGLASPSSEAAVVPKKKPLVARAAPAEPAGKEANEDGKGTSAGSEPIKLKKPAVPPKKAAVAPPKKAPVAEDGGKTEAIPAEDEESEPAKKKPAALKKPVAANKKPAGAPKQASAEGKEPKATKQQKNKDGPKRPKSAYMFFSEIARPKIKEDNPGAQFGELGKLLGDRWAALSSEEKQQYQALAEADKERYGREKAEASIQGVSSSKAHSGAGAAKKRSTKTPFQVFCDAKRPEIEAANPEAGCTEVAALLTAAWRELDEPGRFVYETQAEEMKKQLAAAGSKKRKAESDGGAASKRGRKKKEQKQVAVKDGADGDDAETEDASNEEDSEDEVDRQGCEYFQEAVAEHIICQTRHGKFLVAREGKGLMGYGVVDAQAAKLQRLGQSSSSAVCPVSLEQLEEYEAWEKAFKRAVHDNMERGAMVLEDLTEGSPLEACFILGVMREDKYGLDKADKGDTMMKVPLLATSRAVQRFINIERLRTAAVRQELEEWKARAQSAEAMVAARAGGKAAAAAREDSPGTKQRKGQEC